MKDSTKENLKVALLAWMTIAMLIGSMVVLDWAGLDWQKWSAFGWWTLVVFGILLLKYGDDLKKLRCLLVFILLLVMHTTAWFFVLTSGISVHRVYYMISSPLEAGAGAFILMALGGARGNELGRNNRRIKLRPNRKDES